MTKENDIVSAGVKAFKQNNFILANQLFSEFEKKNESGNLPEILIYCQAVCYCRLEEYKQATFYFERLIKTTNRRFLLLHSNMLLGYIYCKMKKLDKAEEHLYSLLSSNMENCQLYSLLGYIYQERGDHPQAEYYYSKSLSLDPSNANSNNSMGYNYLEWGEHVDKALKYIQKAIQKDGNNHAYLDSLGWYFFIKKNFSKALYYISKALRFGSSKESKRHLDEVKKRI